MDKYKKQNIDSYLKDIKNEILTDWLVSDILSGEFKSQATEEKKQDTGVINLTDKFYRENERKQFRSTLNIDDDDDDDIDIDAELDTSWLEELTLFPKDEKKKFERYLDKSGLKPTTIKNHLRNLDKYEKFATGKKNQDGFYKSIMNSDVSTSQKLTIASTLSKYLQFMESPNDKIIRLIIEINNELKGNYSERNRETNYEVNVKKIENQMNKFFEEGKYKHFIISYLVFNFNVRNTDLNLILCKYKPKAESTEKKHNYLYYADDKYEEYLKQAAINSPANQLTYTKNLLQKYRKELSMERARVAPTRATKLRREGLIEEMKEAIKADNKELIEKLKEEEKKLYPPATGSAGRRSKTKTKEWIEYKERIEDLKDTVEDLKKKVKSILEGTYKSKSISYVNHYFTPIYFVRNNYKTRETYGQKIHKILDKRFHIAYHTYRDWILKSYDNEVRKIEQPISEDRFAYIADLYKGVAINKFVEKQLSKKLALNPKNSKKYVNIEGKPEDEKLLTGKEFLANEYMEYDSEDYDSDYDDYIRSKERFTGYMDTFADILRYYEPEKVKNIKPNEKVPHIIYKNNEIIFVGSPEYWEKNFKYVLGAMNSDKYREWVIYERKKKELNTKQLVGKLEDDIKNFEEENFTILNTKNPKFVRAREIRMTVSEDGILTFYGNKAYWQKRIQNVKKRHKDLLRMKFDNILDFYQVQQLIVDERTKERVAKAFFRLREVDLEIAFEKSKATMNLKNLEKLKKERKQLKETTDIFLPKVDVDGKVSVLEISPVELEPITQLIPMKEVPMEEESKEMEGGGRKKKEEESKEAQEEAKQKRKEEVAEQRRQRLAVIRERRSKQARERKEKEKESKTRKKELSAREKFRRGLGLTRKFHYKPEDVIIFPDDYIVKDKKLISSGRFLNLIREKLGLPTLASGKAPTYTEPEFSIDEKTYMNDFKNKSVIKDCLYLFKQPFYNSTNIVKRHLPFNLKTSDILKIILKEKNTLADASKIGSRRGTSLRTLQDSYNLNR